jgi:hypothetical protein
MVGVGVDVEQRDPGREGASDLLDRRAVTPLGDVGHCLEHDAYPTKA